MKFTARMEMGSFRSKKRVCIKALGRLAQDCVHEGAIVGLTVAKAGRWKDQTGLLRSRIKIYRVRSSKDGAEWALFSPAQYSGFIEFGTRPHWIRPTAPQGFIGPTLQGQSQRTRHNKKVSGHVALRWRGPDGRYHFAKAVFHPGTNPLPFMRPAAERAEDEMISFALRGFVAIGGLW